MAKLQHSKDRSDRSQPSTKKNENISKPQRKGVQMKVKREFELDFMAKQAGSTSRMSSLKSKTESFDILLRQMESIEAEDSEKTKNMVITRGPLGEREITFAVDRKKRRHKPTEDDEEEQKDGTLTRKERDNGRKQQRFKGRRSASNNAIRKLG
ncbi:hypothetical protein V1512DRAFT_255727 [Lipomyces arxii]|uniref:uncharacterized protein n=1 Tax=Lipomyces arxii TaxID=56418 RepID=UPI0034CF4195